MINNYYYQDWVKVPYTGLSCMTIETPYTCKVIPHYECCCHVEGYDYYDISTHIKYTNNLYVNELKNEVFKTFETCLMCWCTCRFAVENYGCYQYWCFGNDNPTITITQGSCVTTLDVCQHMLQEMALLSDYEKATSDTGFQFNPFRRYFMEFPMIQQNCCIGFKFFNENGTYANHFQRQFDDGCYLYMMAPSDSMTAADLVNLKDRKIYTASCLTYPDISGFEVQSPFQIKDYWICFESPCKYVGTLVVYTKSNYLAYIPLTNIKSATVTTDKNDFYSNCCNWDYTIGGSRCHKLIDGRSMYDIGSEYQTYKSYNQINNKLSFTADTYVMDNNEARDLAEYGFPNILDIWYFDYNNLAIYNIELTSKPAYAEYKGQASYALTFKLK